MSNSKSCTSQIQPLQLRFSNLPSASYFFPLSSASSLVIISPTYLNQTQSCPVLKRVENRYDTIVLASIRLNSSGNLLLLDNKTASLDRFQGLDPPAATIGSPGKRNVKNRKYFCKDQTCRWPACASSRSAPPC